MYNPNKAKDKYNKKTYDQISIRVPKGERERFKEAADKRGLSLAQLIRKAVELYISENPEL